jgi:hypothetical protein
VVYRSACEFKFLFQKSFLMYIVTTSAVINAWAVKSDTQRDNFNECAREDPHLSACSYNCTEQGTVSSLAIIPLGTEPIRHTAQPSVSQHEVSH